MPGKKPPPWAVGGASPFRVFGQERLSGIDRFNDFPGRKRRRSSFREHLRPPRAGLPVRPSGRAGIVAAEQGLVVPVRFEKLLGANSNQDGVFMAVASEMPSAGRLRPFLGTRPEKDEAIETLDEIVERPIQLHVSFMEQ